MPKRLLIVESEGTCTAAAYAVFSEEEWAVEPFGDPKAALDSIGQAPPDAIVCESQLDGLTGAQFAENVREIPGAEHIPVFLAGTPTAPAVVREDGLIDGGLYYPYEPEDLRDLLLGRKIYAGRQLAEDETALADFDDAFDDLFTAPTPLEEPAPTPGGDELLPLEEETPPAEAPAFPDFGNLSLAEEEPSAAPPEIGGLEETPALAPADGADLAQGPDADALELEPLETVDSGEFGVLDLSEEDLSVADLTEAELAGMSRDEELTVLELSDLSVVDLAEAALDEPAEDGELTVLELSEDELSEADLAGATPAEAFADEEIATLELVGEEELSGAERAAPAPVETLEDEDFATLELVGEEELSATDLSDAALAESFEVEPLEAGCLVVEPFAAVPAPEAEIPFPAPSPLPELTAEERDFLAEPSAEAAAEADASLLALDRAIEASLDSLDDAPSPLSDTDDAALLSGLDDWEEEEAPAEDAAAILAASPFAAKPIVLSEDLEAFTSEEEAFLLETAGLSPALSATAQAEDTVASILLEGTADAEEAFDFGSLEEGIPSPAAPPPAPAAREEEAFDFGGLEQEAQLPAPEPSFDFTAVEEETAVALSTSPGKSFDFDELEESVLAAAPAAPAFPFDALEAPAPTAGDAFDFDAEEVAPPARAVAEAEAARDAGRPLARDILEKALAEALEPEALREMIRASIEKVVWEVVPPLAERLLEEAIRKMQAPPDA